LGLTEGQTQYVNLPIRIYPTAVLTRASLTVGQYALVNLSTT